MWNVIQAIQTSPAHDPVVANGYYAYPDNTGFRPLCHTDESLSAVKEMFGLLDPNIFMEIMLPGGMLMVAVQEKFDAANMEHRNVSAEMLIHGFTEAGQQGKSLIPDPRYLRGDIIVILLTK